MASRFLTQLNMTAACWAALSRVQFASGPCTLDNELMDDAAITAIGGALAALLTALGGIFWRDRQQFLSRISELEIRVESMHYEHALEIRGIQKEHATCLAENAELRRRIEYLESINAPNDQ